MAIPGSFFLNRNYQTIGKMLALAILAIFFLIPFSWISSTISERAGYYQRAKNEISKSWSQPQIVMGPFLMVPYSEPLENGRLLHENYIFLPEDLKINIALKPEVRSRGIFDVVVYEAKLILAGSFTQPQKQNFSHRNFKWGEAKIVLGIADSRGIDSLATIFRGERTLLEPGIVIDGINTISGLVPINSFEGSVSKNLPFEIGVTLKGSDSIEFMPVGKETFVEIQSTWSSPSFIGNFLPNKRNISASGFNASWKIPFFAKSFPQNFSGAVNLVNARTKNAFGVRLLDPASGYTKSERAIKYAVLFILYTFLFYFLFEMVKSKQIHIFQYVITGCSLLSFFVILTALSEHINFDFAYLTGALAVVCQISLYIFKIIQSWRERLSFLAVLIGVYIYLYIVLQLEDYAFLIGAFGTFVAISCAMYFTRNIKWFENSNNSYKTQ